MKQVNESRYYENGVDFEVNMEARVVYTFAPGSIILTSTLPFSHFAIEDDEHPTLDEVRDAVCDWIND